MNFKHDTWTRTLEFELNNGQLKPQVSFKTSCEEPTLEL